MPYLTSCMFCDVVILTAVALLLLYLYLTRTFGYWKKRNVPYIKPLPVFGNIKDAARFKKNLSVVMQDLYNELDGHKYGGIFQMKNPTLLLRDPDIIKVIMVKDFPHFQDRGINIDLKLNPLAQHLFLLGGWRWRVLRAKLSPTFTSGKMKMMFQVMEECSRRLQKFLAEPASKGEILELKDVLAKFTTDVIGTCAFGLETNALENPDSEFRRMGKKIFKASSWSAFKRLLSVFLPAVAKILRISALDTDVTKFFLNVVKETVEYREKNNIHRNDFLQLLIELKNKGKVDDEETDHRSDSKEGLHKTDEKKLEMTDSFLAAQVFVFFLAGFETSSTTMSFALHELAVNPDVQTKLREEIDRTLQETKGEFTYDAIMNMKYMDKVVSETLRKYPPVGILSREVTVPYTLPQTNTKLDVGTKVAIPVYALQHDPKYFPNPERFDPERFSEEEKAKRPNYVYMPFGEGPRNCIGMRFGLLQTKMGLASLLAKYEFHVCERTEVPLRLDPRATVTASMTGTILKITNRRDSRKSK